MGIGLALMTIGSLLAMAGALARMVWLAQHPRRYARCVYRKDTPAPMSSTTPNVLGIALICAGAASFMSGVFWAS
jgi:hypothetical protein